MSILDTFYILYKTNAKEVDKDSKSAEKSVDDLEKSLRASDKTAQALAYSFDKIITKGIGALAAYASFEGIKNGIVNTAAMNAEFEKLSRISGQSAATISALDAAVVQAGGSAGEFSTWLTQLNQQFVNMGMGNRTPQILQNLRGMAAEWQKAGLSMSQMIALGNKFNIPQDVVLLMAKGPETMDALIAKYEKLQNLSAENAKDAREFETATQEVESQWRGLMTHLTGFATGLLHVFSRILRVVDDIATLNGGDFIKMYHEDKAKQDALEKGQSAPSNLSPEEESKMFWLSKGYDKNQIAGLLATESAESRFDPAAVGDNGQAKGIFQWHEDRRNRILNGTGIDISNANHLDQLKAADWEMQQRGDDSRLRGTSSAEDAATILTKYFERPADIFGQSAYRGKLADQYVGKMSDLMTASSDALKMADNSPLNSQGGSQNNITFGSITITVPPGSDGKAIGDQFTQTINDHFRATIGNYDDGVQY